MHLEKDLMKEVNLNQSNGTPLRLKTRFHGATIYQTLTVKEWYLAFLFCMAFLQIDIST